MLKLTNSFCRYLKFTFKNIYYSNNLKSTHLKSFTQLSSRRNISVQTDNIQNTPPKFLVNFGRSLRQLSNIPKRYKFKKYSANSNVVKKYKQMAESLQPTIEHGSYGGQFNISSNDGTSGMRNQFMASGSNSKKKEKCPIPPDFRVWEPVFKAIDANDGSTFKFKILSYNVLAQYLLESHPYLYTDCASNNLSWKVRAARIYDEIINIAPDILLLQEVQVSHLNDFYAKFEEIGYKGIFKQKTGDRQDGCAIYYKEALFDLQDQLSVEYYQPDLPMLNRDNIGIMVKLLPKNYTGQPMVVATTHLLYNPKRTDVRLAQLQLLLAEIDRFAYYTTSGKSGHLPIILTGDFNSTPESAVIKLLEKGQVSATSYRDDSDWSRIGVTDNCQHLSVYLNRQIGIETNFSMTKIYHTEYLDKCDDAGSDEEESNFCEMFNSGELSHPLNLISTYCKNKADGNWEATTFQNNWTTVDYIYYSFCANLKLVERLRLPTASECEVLGCLPNNLYGSDHLALAAVFEINNKSM